MHALLALVIAVAPIPVAYAGAPDSSSTVEPSSAEPSSAEPLPDAPAQRAGVLFEEGRFAEAAAAFDEAYAASGDAVFLFGRAQALRRAGNCAAAIDVLQTFIDTGPPESDSAEAQRVIDACRVVLGESERAAAPEPAPAPAPTPAPSAAEEPDDAPPRSAWIRDVAGGVLLGTGAFATVAGVTLYAGSYAMARDREESESEFEQRSQRVKGVTVAGIAVLAVGGALMLGSVIRYSIVARRGARRRRSPRGSAALSWRF